MTVLSQPESERKKQLGQYFTGRAVGRLLAAAAGAQDATAIIDPMVGSADLLLSCLEVGADPERLVGLELDPLALAKARAALGGRPGVELILADAFVVNWPDEQFDLVITNPPYIRYQSRAEVAGISVPTSADVRQSLVKGIEERAELPSAVRSLMLDAARSYPGTADIAVPAWILSASLVREGGMLAVVAPQAWLSRNYASPVRELLDSVFQVEMIIEDGDASWFDDAQVRTQLVVARRRPVGPSVKGRPVVRARATRELKRNGSLCGGFASEHEVAHALRKFSSTASVEVTTGLTAHVQRDLQVAAVVSAGHVPERVSASMGVEANGLETRTLESYGWRVGQGIRTGANEFFYVSERDGEVFPAARWGRLSLPIPTECLLPVIRRQSELGGGLAVEPDFRLPSRIVNLQGWVTASDRHAMSPTADVRILPEGVASWISMVSSAPLSAKDPDRHFPDLTAVAPNRKTDSNGRPTRFWYQLPKLTPRHRPTLFIGRVCGGQPTTYANNVGAVIDANFSTLWPVAEAAIPAEALLALLHSGWVWATLEATCTVLGGGALKVEATDLRRLPLPDLNGDDISRLAHLGQTLLANRDDDIVLAIDETVAKVLGRRGGGTPVSSGPRAFAAEALVLRSRRSYAYA